MFLSSIWDSTNKAKDGIAGAGIELLSLKPRTESKVEDQVYKVNERITTLSYEGHVKYSNKDWFVGAKTVLGSNLTQTSMLGGFGIKSIDNRTGEQKYTPIRGIQFMAERSIRTEMETGYLPGICQEYGNKRCPGIQSSIRNRNQCGPSGDSRC